MGSKPEPAWKARRVPTRLRVLLEQRRRQVAGLAILAILILIFSIWRAGLSAVFPTGWWRIW